MNHGTDKTSWLLALLFAGVLGVALFFHGATQDAVLHLVFLLLLAPLLLALLTLPERFLEDRRWLLLVGIGAALAVAVAWQPTLSARGLVLAALAWGALFLGARVALSGGLAARLLLFALVALGAAEAGYGLLEPTAMPDVAAGDPEVREGLATGTLVNPNHFAGLLAMLLPLALAGALGAFWRGRRSPERRGESYAQAWLFVLASVAMTAAIAAAQSDAGMVAVGAVLGLFVVALAWSAWGTAVGVPLLAAALAAAAGTVVWRWQWVLDLLDSKGRLGVFQDTLALIGDHPWSGVGPGMYVWALRPYYTGESFRIYEHAHNDYLEIAAEWGLPVAVLLWGFLLWRLARGVQRFLGRQGSSWDRAVALGCAGTILAILVLALVDFNLQIPANAMVFFAVVGVSWGLEMAGRRGEAPPPIPHPAATP